MFYNDWAIQRLATLHQRELQRQAEAERFARAGARQPDRVGRWLNSLGGQLVIIGQRLQAQHRGVLTHAVLHTEYHRSRSF